MKFQKFEDFVNEGASSDELQKYVKDVSTKTFNGGGNGQNLLDNAMELAYHIDAYRKGRKTYGPEEDGFYGPTTVTLFKKLVDQMSKDDILMNNIEEFANEAKEQ